MIMPWGKYKGAEIGDLPSSYLKWLAAECDDEDICVAADDEYNWRTDGREHWED
jgi:hypothetical protein